MRQTNGTTRSIDAPFDGAFPWGDEEWFRDLDHTEDRCREYLEALRWPAGVTCPRCDSADTSPLPVRKRHYCRECRYHFSATSGTLLHRSHLPLWKWFLTISLMIDSKGGLPANQLVSLLGVTYKTAWFLEHRVRAALQEAPAGAVRVPSTNGRSNGRGARDRVFDRELVGRYHQLDLKYLAAYQAESDWRRRSRRNPNAFRDTVLRLLGGDPLAYAELVGRNRPGGPASAPEELLKES